MDIKNKHFPYPILCSYNDDYIKSSFTYNLEQIKSFKEIVLEYNIENSNSELNNMLAIGATEYVFHIECGVTSYRKIIKSKEVKGEIKIPLIQVDNVINLNLFIIAKEDITNYTNSDFNPDYEGISFYINKGNIIAIANPVIINVEKQDEDLGNVESIFSISRRAADDEAEIKINLNTDKIKLLLNAEDYANYNNILNIPGYIPVLHSTLIFPALIYIFEDLKKGGFEDYSNTLWFKSMLKTFENNGSLLTSELLENRTSFELAQAVLDSPVKRAFQQLINTITNDDEEDE